MVKIHHAGKIAFAKLRAHKIRTFFVVLFVGFCFAILFSASLLIAGIFKNLDQAGENRLNNRHILAVEPYQNPDEFSKLLKDKKLIANAEEKWKNLVQEKSESARNLGVEYDPALEPKPYSVENSREKSLDVFDENKISRAVLDEYFRKNPTTSDVESENIAKKYGAKNIFEIKYFYLEYGNSLTTIPQNYEEISNSDLENSTTDKITLSPSMTVADDVFAREFISPKNDWQPEKKSIPLILPEDQAAQLLKKYNKNVFTENGKINRKKLENLAINFTFSACFRNATANDFLQLAIAQNNEIAKNKNNKNYESPKLIYELPRADSCENIKIKSDTRSFSEKIADENQAKFDKIPEQKNYSVPFQIVGIAPAAENNQEIVTNLSDLLTKIFSVVSPGQIIPKSFFEKMNATKLYPELFFSEKNYVASNDDNVQKFVEFASKSEMQKFLNEQACQVGVEGICQPANRDYYAAPAFSNSGAIQEMKNILHTYFNYAIFGVAIFAAILMFFVIRRTIIENRKEAAIFRAIGFRRRDIFLIYFCYIVMILLLICLSITIFVAMIILILAPYFSQAILTTIQTVYGFLPASIESVVAFNESQFLQISLFGIGALMIGFLLPLIFSLRRNISRDLRE